MKKITAVLLAVLMLLPMAVTALAIPLSSGNEALNKQKLHPPASTMFTILPSRVRMTALNILFLSGFTACAPDRRSARS